MSVNVGSAIAYLDLDTSKFTSGIALAKSALKEFITSSDSLSVKFQNLGSSLSSAGSSMTKSLTLPIAALGTAAVKTASDFDSSMSKVEAVSGATADEMTKLREKAIEMGAKTKFSAKESADAFTYMAMAGWDAGQMIDGISGIMSLAAADGLDLATTSDIVTDALTAFGLQASDSSHFADVLAQASSSANTNVSMLGESFKYVAPVAGSLGMSVEDTALALGLMANAGIKSTQAGTALRSSLTNLVKPTDDMAVKMEELGIEVTNSDGTMKSLKDIMDILRDKFSTLSEAEQANAAATLFGKEAMSGMLAIINTSQSDYDKLANAISNADGRAQEMSDTMMNNLNGSLTLLKSAVESLLIKLGEALVPTIQKITELITSWVEKLNSLSDEQVEHIAQLAVVVAAIGPVLIIVGKVISIIGSVISVGAKLFAGIKAIVTFISGVLIPAIGSISAPVLIVIAVIGALIAAGVALYKNWDEVSAWAEKTWNSIKESVGSAIESIGQFFSDLGQSVSDTIQSIEDRLSGLWESISQFFSNLADDISGLVESVGSWLSGLWEDISGFFENLFSNIGEWFKQVTTTISEFFSSLVKNVSSSIDEIWTKIVSWGTNMVEKAKEIASGFVENFVSFFRNLSENVSSTISGMIGMISQWGSNIINKGKEISSGFTSAVKSGIEKVGSFFSEMFIDIINSVTSLGTNIFEAGKNLITQLWKGMKSVFSSLVSWLTESLSSLFKPLTDMLDKVIRPVKNLFSNIGGFVGNILSGSHANGLDYVPYDGYIAQLHEGERILTKSENQDYKSDNRQNGGGDTYIFNSPEAIDEYKAARLLKQTKQELDMGI